MQFCKGIQVAALLAALSTAGLAAPVAESNAIAARDVGYGDVHDNYGNNNDYGKNDYGNADNYDYSSWPKCDDDHTVKVYSWIDFVFHGHKIKIFVFKNKYFTYGRDKKYYVYDVSAKTWSLCKYGEYDFRAVKPYGDIDYYYDPSYGNNYDNDGYNSGHDGYDSDGYSSGHDDYDDHKVIYGKDISSYFSKFDWNRYTSKYNKFQTKSVKWYKTKINGYDAEYYIEGGNKYTWAKYNNAYVVFVYDNASKRWGYDPHHNTRPSNWCKQFATIDVFYGKNHGYDSDHDNYDPSYGKGYDTDSDKDSYGKGYDTDSDKDSYGKGYDGEDPSKYYNVLYADNDRHAVYFKHKNNNVYCAADGFYTYKNGRYERYTALKFSKDYYRNAYFTKFLTSHKSLYFDRTKWNVVKFGKNYGSGYDSHSEYDPHSDNESDCSDSEDDYSKGYGSKKDSY